MKTLTFSITVLLATILSIAVSKATGPQTFTGEIMDVQCDLLKSHDMMMKQKGLKDAAECTQACVKDGGKVVLYDSAHQKVYQLRGPAKSDTVRRPKGSGERNARQRQQHGSRRQCAGYLGINVLRRAGHPGPS
jgi:hypothetical protein